MATSFSRARLTLTKQQQDAFRSFLIGCAPTVRKAGNQLFGRGRVLWVEQAGTSFLGVIADPKEYSVDWDWDGSLLSSDCSCEDALDCAHTVALADFVLASAVVVGASEARPLPGSSRMDLAERLRVARDPWQARSILRDELSHPTLRFEAYDPRIAQLLDDAAEEDDPELRCWRLAQRVLALSKGVLPPGLEAYRDRPELLERREQAQREQLSRALLVWANSKRDTPTRSLRLVVTPDIVEDDRAVLSISARVTSARLDDAPRSTDQLHQLLSEAKNTPGTLREDEMRLLVVLLQGPYHWSPSQALQALLQVRPMASTLLCWDTAIKPAALQRSGVTPGGPITLDPTTARIVPTVTTDDHGALVHLACHWEEGRTRMLNEVLYYPAIDSSHASMVIADGVVSIVVDEPPLEIQGGFRRSGGLAIPHARCAEIIVPLAKRFPHVRRVLDEHTRLLDGQAVIALDLRDDDWLHVRAFVYQGKPGWLPHVEPEPGSTLAELMPNDTWQVVVRPPEAAARDATQEAGRAIWAEAPDPQTVNPVHAWLTALEVEPGHRLATRSRRPDVSWIHVGWWVYLSAKRMDLFAELWEKTPPSLMVVCTERLHRLIRGAHTVRPKIRIASSGVDWFAIAAEWEGEGLALSDADMAKLRASTSRFLRLPSGWVRRDAVETHDAMSSFLADLGIEVGGGEQRLTLWQLAGAKDESIAALEKLGADPQAARALTRLRRQVARFKGVPEVAVPASIKAELRPYQRRGFDFLAYTSGLGIGALLADDMGLGKTLQTLVWLQWLVDGDPKGGPSLVVCPTSVMHNWVREAAQFAPQLRVLALQRGEERHELRKEIHRYDLVVTNYALLRRDIEQWEEIKLRAVVLDEAQNIKNPDAAVSQAACSLQAKHRLALTGTPLENRPLDLWSISNFINPGYLGDRTRFGQRFDRVDAAPHTRALLAAKLRPVLLRRLKREVAADLPERIEERRDCELTDGQRLLYLAELRRSRKLIDELSADDTSLRKNKITILAALTRLRQICCHPALAKGKADLGSGKFEALFELLEPLLDEGHKVLLFSQFVQCLTLLEKEMRQRKIPCHKLTGQTVQREAVVSAFQEDPEPSVFLISLKAGGTGLNLTAASYVILFDPWWNPAVEAQAIDRTHRIGQDRTVIAYRMISIGTIEEKIWHLQQRKSAMARDILGEDGFARALGRDDLSYLLQEV